ncbi:hypothetical protein BCR44DRAFT_1517738 [Catenaria anguillulae PL171]|uniref:Uncharacterized protein n=1 Tax=Catenaria anguillulae PL171 TaxID=765915 RepID=A0A1Y2H622_9FUNG|nr:hypothetical protein BCR44DRAFT_1517738 [Catenaria anguillulae PL171]
MSFPDRTSSLVGSAYTEPCISHYHSHASSILSTARSGAPSAHPSTGHVSRTNDVAAPPRKSSLGDGDTTLASPHLSKPLHLHPISLTTWGTGADPNQSSSPAVTRGFSIHSNSNHLKSPPPTATLSTIEHQAATEQDEQDDHHRTIIEQAVSAGDECPWSPTHSSVVFAPSAISTVHPQALASPQQLAPLSPLPPSFSPLPRADLERLCASLHSDALESRKIAQAATDHASAMDKKLDKLTVQVMRALKDAQRRERKDWKVLQAKAREADALRDRLGKVMAILSSVIPGLLDGNREGGHRGKAVESVER